MVAEWYRSSASAVTAPLLSIFAVRSVRRSYNIADMLCSEPGLRLDEKSDLGTQKESVDLKGGRSFFLIFVGYGKTVSFEHNLNISLLDAALACTRISIRKNPSCHCLRVQN